MGETLNDLGDIYREWGQYEPVQYENAFKFYRAALSVHKEIGYDIGVALTLNDIGNIYEKMEQYKEALAYYREARKIQQNIGDTKGLSETLKDIGSIQRKFNHLEEALEFHEKALSLAELSLETENLAKYYFELGLDYRKLGHIDLTLQNFQKALSIYQKILLEMPEEHYNAFAKQITPLLSLIQEVEPLAKFSNQELLTALKKEVRQIYKSLLKKKNVIEKNIIESRISMIPQAPKQIPYKLEGSSLRSQLKIPSSQKSIPNKLQENYVSKKRSDFELLLKIFERVIRMEEKIDKIQSDVDKNQILNKLRFYISKPKELEQYLRKIFTSNWSPDKKDLYQKVIIELLDDNLNEKWYIMLGNAVADIAGKILTDSLVDLARLGFGKLAKYLRKKLS
ncbi:MAG: tetratricopeptide repeat protein [Candidatus Helarchaeota archaeon]